MKSLELYLQGLKKYSNYQIKQIIYLFKTISSDISKVIILGFIFWNHLYPYLAALTLLFLLRSFSGGMHFDTYLGCLATTAGYFILSIIVLPPIYIPLTAKILLLVVCMIICDRLGPITSKYRPPLSSPKIILCRNITLSLIFLFIVLLYIIPDSPYMTVGFWVIILHSLQLAFAKLVSAK